MTQEVFLGQCLSNGRQDPGLKADPDLCDHSLKGTPSGPFKEEPCSVCNKASGEQDPDRIYLEADLQENCSTIQLHHQVPQQHHMDQDPPNSQAFYYQQNSHQQFLHASSSFMPPNNERPDVSKFLTMQDFRPHQQQHNPIGIRRGGCGWGDYPCVPIIQSPPMDMTTTVLATSTTATATTTPFGHNLNFSPIGHTGADEALASTSSTAAFGVGLANFEKSEQQVVVTSSRSSTKKQKVPSSHRGEASKVVVILDKDKLERKRERNRVAAFKCRQRKLERIQTLEEEVEKLQREVAELSRKSSQVLEENNRLKAELHTLHEPLRDPDLAHHYP